MASTQVFSLYSVLLAVYVVFFHEKGSLFSDNGNLAHFHGFKCILVALRSHACTAGSINNNLCIRKCSLKKNGVGNNADISTETNKFNLIDRCHTCNSADTSGKTG